MKKIRYEDDDTTIKVWGYPNKNGEINFRVNMFAEIRTFSFGVLEKIQEKLDRKLNLLGTEKVHAKLEYRQTAAVITYEVFEALS